MFERKRARVGLLGLTLELYQSIAGLYEELSSFGNELTASLSDFVDVSFPGICYTSDQVEGTIHAFEEAEMDLVLVVFLSYSPSLISSSALIKTKMPVLIFNTQKLFDVPSSILSWETTKNHGMHGVQDLTNVLLRDGKKFSLITGHYQDKATLHEVEKYCEVARIIKWMGNARIGLIGYPMQWMGDFSLDAAAFQNQMGVKIQHIAMRDVHERSQNISSDVLHKQWLLDSERFSFAPEITEDDYCVSERLVIAIREILKEYNLAGFASHFTAIGEEGILDTLPFLASSKLLSEGYGFGGEGDATCAAMVAIMAQLTGEASFTEMFTMDFSNDSILMMHMGEANYKIAREDEPVHLLRSALGLVNLRVDPVLLAFSYKMGRVTLASLTTTANGRLKIVATEGEILDYPYADDLGRPHGKFKPDCKLSTFLTKYSEEGGSHHLAMSYGHYTDHLRILCETLGIGYARV